MTMRTRVTAICIMKHLVSVCLVAKVPGFAIAEFSDIGSSANCRQVPTLCIR